MSEKYELISKSALDIICYEILRAKESSKDVEVLNHLNTAYLMIQENRTQCNVKPEGAE